jgi:hypothetical protein
MPDDEDGARNFVGGDGLFDDAVELRQRQWSGSLGFGRRLRLRERRRGRQTGDGQRNE